MRAVFDGPALGVLDDERNGSLDELVEAASDGAVTFGVEAEAFVEIGLGLLEEKR